MNKASVTYITNSGVCIEYKDKKILIDAVHTETALPYLSVDNAVLEKMLLNKEPYNNIDLMLFTHHHIDHFDAKSCNEILKRNKHAQLVGTQNVLSQIKAADNYNDVLISQLWGMQIPMGTSMQICLKDIPCEISCVTHDGAENAGVLNYTYMFEVRRKVFLHVGDAQVSVKNFEPTPIFNRKIDVLMVPFTFIGLTEGRKVISKINPQKLLVMHLPDRKYDKMNWGLKTAKVYKKYASELPDTVFLEEPGQSVLI